MKRPSFQFYVGDWQSNSNLRRCTFGEKRIWLDVMCLMHDAEQYGSDNRPRTMIWCRCRSTITRCETGSMSDSTLLWHYDALKLGLARMKLSLAN
jgi:hypothetical protein